jgi:HK97 family phage portal protein
MIANALSIMLPQRRAVTHSPDDEFYYRPVGQTAASGVNVTPGKAMGVSAVFGCIRVLRESLGSLPWKVLETVGDAKKPAKDHYLWRVLHDKPNSWQTPMEFKEMAVNHVCLRGNFYCQVFGNGDRMQLRPLSPDRVFPEQLPSREITYKYQQPSGEKITIRQEDMFHVRGMSLNGVEGVSVIEFARNTVGASIAQESHGSSLFANGGLPTFWISRPRESKWTPNARKNFREEWRSVHAGAENAGQPPILGDGMELHELGLTNRDSQWIESRAFEDEAICRFFGVHPVMIGVNSTSPLSTKEDRANEFVTYTLGPLAVRFQEAADRDLIDDPDKYSTKIVLDALLRGDLKSRYEAHNIAVQGGWKTKNEVREVEDLNPMEGGDDLQQALNMQPAGGGPDGNEQGGQPGKGTPKPPEPDDEATAFEKRKKKAEAQPAFEILLDEAARRIASHEVSHLEKRVGKAADNHDAWKEFLTAFFVDKHEPYAAKVLDPICAAWLAATGQQFDRIGQRLTPKGLANFLTGETDAMFDRDSDKVAILTDWKTTRADQLAAALKQEFFG